MKPIQTRSLRGQLERAIGGLALVAALAGCAASISHEWHLSSSVAEAPWWTEITMEALAPPAEPTPRPEPTPPREPTAATADEDDSPPPTPTPTTTPTPGTSEAGLVVTAPGDVLFDSGSATPRHGASTFFAQVVLEATRSGATAIVVECHTDADGSEADNLTLSEQRAAAVVDGLITAQLPDRIDIEAIGLGETMPLHNNETETGKARNRRCRLELHIIT